MPENTSWRVYVGSCVAATTFVYAIWMLYGLLGSRHRRAIRRNQGKLDIESAVLPDLEEVMELAKHKRLSLNLKKMRDGLSSCWSRSRISGATVETETMTSL